jgi:hypothetical protein
MKKRLRKSLNMQINRHDDGSLTKDAHDRFSKGLFLFDDTDGFQEKLYNFLSLPIKEIEELWNQKKDARSEMINKYFSTFEFGSGKRAVKIILNECF